MLSIARSLCHAPSVSEYDNARPRTITGRVVTPAGVRHAQRIEDPLAREIRERFPGGALHHHCQQVVVGVAVFVLAARREVELAHPANDRQHVAMIERAGVAGPAADAGNRAPIAQARRMVQQLPQRHRCAVVGELRQPAVDVVVERETAIAREEQHGRRRELLGHRAGLENARRRQRDPALQVRAAPGALEDRLAVLGDSQDASGGRVGIPRRKDGVETRLRVDRSSRG
jgi:hypothetical protein